MSDNRSFEERVKDFRALVENAPPHIRAEFLPHVERAEKIVEQRRAEIMKNNCIKKDMVIKRIEMELAFPKGFMPPEKFRGDTSTPENPCSWCPFFGWDDETADGWCNVPAVRDVTEECPIKRFFN